MGFFKWFVIMELNSALDAVTQAYCEQLCCYSHCGLFEEGMHTHTYTLTTQNAVDTHKHRSCGKPNAGIIMFCFYSSHLNLSSP